MKRVATAVVLIAVVFLAIFKAPPWLFTILVGIVALLGLREYVDLERKQALQPIPVVSYLIFFVWFVSVAVVFFVNSHKGPRAPDLFGLPVFGAFALIALLPLVGSLFMRSTELRIVLPSSSAELFGFIYIALPFTYLAVMQAQPGGWLLLLFLLIVVWSGDIAAFYVGRLIGKHKLAPRISPGKTWEGALASLIAAVALGVTWVHISTPHFMANWQLWCCGPVGILYGGEIPTHLTLKRGSIPLVVLLAAATNIFSQLGDLFESAIKRAADVKDSGNLLPGHGGILDRVDALLFATPVFYFSLLLLSL
jgi:phosphatidate cytidylyltransferase